VHPATHEWLAGEDGTPTPALGDMYEELAASGVGLISISEFVSTSKSMVFWSPLQIKW
jgi:2,4-dienoyl-CoA reductase-like NADH-dependent reductase (Old Yellow Enzyme family)